MLLSLTCNIIYTIYKTNKQYQTYVYKFGSCKYFGAQCNVASKRTSPSVATYCARAPEGAGVRLLSWKSELRSLVLEKLFLDRRGTAMFVVCKYINPSGYQRVRCQRLWWVSRLLTLLSSPTPIIKTGPCLVSVGIVKSIPQQMMQPPMNWY